MAVLYVPGSDPSRVYYGTDTHATALLTGAALAMTWPLARLAASSREAAARLDVLGVIGLTTLSLGGRAFLRRRCGCLSVRPGPVRALGGGGGHPGGRGAPAWSPGCSAGRRCAGSGSVPTASTCGTGRSSPSATAMAGTGSATLHGQDHADRDRHRGRGRILALDRGAHPAPRPAGFHQLRLRPAGHLDRRRAAVPGQRPPADRTGHRADRDRHRRVRDPAPPGRPDARAADRRPARRSAPPPRPARAAAPIRRASHRRRHRARGPDRTAPAGAAARRRGGHRHRGLGHAGGGPAAAGGTARHLPRCRDRAAR